MMKLVNPYVFDVERILNQILGNPNRFANVFQGMTVSHWVNRIMESYSQEQKEGFPDERIFGMLIMDLLVWMKMEGVNARKAVEAGFQNYQKLVKLQDDIKNKVSDDRTPS